MLSKNDRAFAGGFDGTIPGNATRTCRPKSQRIRIGVPLGTPAFNEPVRGLQIPQHAFHDSTDLDTVCLGDHRFHVWIVSVSIFYVPYFGQGAD